jgi:hypothetical protein
MYAQLPRIQFYVPFPLPTSTLCSRSGQGPFELGCTEQFYGCIAAAPCLTEPRPEADEQSMTGEMSIPNSYVV